VPSEAAQQRSSAVGKGPGANPQSASSTASRLAGVAPAEFVSVSDDTFHWRRHGCPEPLPKIAQTRTGSLLLLWRLGICYFGALAAIAAEPVRANEAYIAPVKDNTEADYRRGRFFEKAARVDVDLGRVRSRDLPFMDRRDGAGDGRPLPWISSGGQSNAGP
jgi:hypothetical protein